MTERELRARCDGNEEVLMGERGSSKTKGCWYKGGTTSTSK